ncbi:MAG TPA: hypothetical protein VLE69_03350 [Candidatus Saccharimonadales bacterium]|nr:hypothetical protein [Candidatus Saccharimonadales bacterium]
MSKLKILVIAVIGLLVMGVGTVSALTHADFYPDAAAWSYDHCREVSATDKQQNTICFLLYSQSENQIRWALQKTNNQTQQNEINALQTGVISKANTYKTESAVGSANTTPTSVEAVCDDDNDILLSGGYTSTADKKMHIVSSQAGSGTTARWVVTAYGEEPGGYAFQAFANCYRVD